LATGLITGVDAVGYGRARRHNHDCPRRRAAVRERQPCAADRDPAGHRRPGSVVALAKDAIAAAILHMATPHHHEVAVLTWNSEPTGRPVLS